MRFAGHVKSWNAERGFGFIEPSGGGQEIFLHISAVPTQLRPPKIGQHFTFEVELNRDGKKRAANVGVATATRSTLRKKPSNPATWGLASVLAIPSFIAIYVALALTRGVSVWFAVAYLLLSIICLLAYSFDKAAAEAGRWRTSEQSLLLLGLAGGWPGGLVAQQLLRHKSSKASFRAAFWGTAAVNVGAFVGFHLYFKPWLATI
ncbi:MAG: DUF1294 domain-containing protein [Rhizobacter sp.]|nr:DUF1294 domain-containing protein [Rhizobacter sp.]